MERLSAEDVEREIAKARDEREATDYKSKIESAEELKHLHKESMELLRSVNAQDRTKVKEFIDRRNKRRIP